MIKKNIIIVLSVYVQFCLGQTNALLNARLDSAINAKMSPKTKFLYVKNASVVVDSLPLKKVQAGKKDSVILITFSDKTQRSINASEFWGIITDFGERRRFYKGIMFPLWSSNAPYLYRITKVNSDRYYFSETLTGDIYPLSLVSVDEHVSEPLTKAKLKAYIKSNLPENITDNDKGNDGELFERLVNTAVTLPVLVLHILAEWYK